MKMPFRITNLQTSRIRLRGLSSRKKLPGSLVLLATMAMVLASPIHLLLAHGHDGSSHVSSQGDSASIPVSCQHHNHCHAHGSSQEQPVDEQDSAPCQERSGSCQTCMALASIVPLQICFDTTVSEQAFLEYTYVIQERPYLDWRGVAISGRGPPALF